MFCRNCGSQLDDKAVACTKCGLEPRGGSAYCHNCGQQTQPNAVVCTSCGVGLAPAAAKASKKIPAGICGILLGWLGVHKFILGYTAPAVIMLAVSLAGGIVTCGVATCVVGIIGLIEGIIYLTKSDEEFVRIYIENKRHWF